MPHLTSPLADKTYVITGPTSGIGRATAIELAKHGAVVLVGRNRQKLDAMQTLIRQRGGQATSVVCDLSDLTSVRRAAAEIAALRRPFAGLLNNAGVLLSRNTKNAQGQDLTFLTNHLGPFVLTEMLIPSLPDQANIVFVVSAIEDPERKPVKAMRLRGGRYISAEASMRGEWAPDGSKLPGMDAYATSKQCSLAAALALARETPRLHINAMEPGINPTTGLGGAPAIVRFVFGQIVTRLPPFVRYRSTPQQAARVITEILTSDATGTGIYFDEKGEPMRGSALVHDPRFQSRVIAETRALLTAIQPTLPSKAIF